MSFQGASGDLGRVISCLLDVYRHPSFTTPVMPPSAKHFQANTHVVRSVYFPSVGLQSPLVRTFCIAGPAASTTRRLYVPVTRTLLSVQRYLRSRRG